MSIDFFPVPAENPDFEKHLKPLPRIDYNDIEECAASAPGMRTGESPVPAKSGEQLLIKKEGDTADGTA